MEKVILAATITTLFTLSTTAAANSGLADRINEARSYPNKEVSAKSTQMHCVQEKKTHMGISKSQATRGELQNVNYKENDSDNHSVDHVHS